MTKDEAIQAMKEGKKVTHRYFTSDEWVSSDKSGLFYKLEDGVTCYKNEFWFYRKQEEWETDWELYEPSL